MSTVTAGNPVTLDALFGQEGQTLPDSVTFELESPDNTTVSFSTGDPEVTNPASGYWECALGVLADPQEYRWRCTGYEGSSVVQTLYGTVFVVASLVDPDPIRPPGPVLGPCFSWIAGEDVAACARVDYGSAPEVFDVVAAEASMALYEISGRQWPGLCERTVRPCTNDCSCWLTGPISYGMGPWFWTSVPWGFGGGWAWYNERGDHFGCAPMSKVNLAGYPVREILEVQIDDTVIPEFDPDTGVRNWRLDKWRYLVRMDLPGSPSQPRFWPSCQNMSLDLGEQGTFGITYTWGSDPPPLGRAAAVEIAEQLYLSCAGNPLCVLPPGTTEVTRQGITVSRGFLANWSDPTKATGLVNTDLFLQAYCDGKRRGRRSMVWSPDLQFMSRKVGTGQGSGGS